MRTLKEEYTAIDLIAAQTTAATLTGSANDVEIYEDDALAVATISNSSGMQPQFTVTVTGSLTATPNTYDQNLATFTISSGSNYGAAAQRCNLFGIKNVKGVATITGSTQGAVAVVLLARAGVKATGNNTATLA